MRRSPKRVTAEVQRNFSETHERFLKFVLRLEIDRTYGTFRFVRRNPTRG